MTAPAVPTSPRAVRAGTPPALLLLLAVAAVERLVALSRFPMVEADEGLWTTSTKNFVRFGDWFMDEHGHALLSPVFHALSLLAFQLGDPSIATARIISALAGIVSVWLLHALVLRLSARDDVALASATVLALSHWAVFMSRKALIEPLQVALVLATLLLATGRDRRSMVLAGLVFGLALLTKINVAFVGVVIALHLGVTLRQGHPAIDWRGVGRAAGLGTIAVAVAAGVYGLLYRNDPARFMSAFVYELDGVHFEGGSQPLLRIGRFGLDPIQGARTLLDLVRAAPFVLVLATLGLGLAATLRRPGTALFALWLAVGVPYFLLQMYQPLRYFFLVVPALAYFAGLTLARLGEGLEGTTGRKAARAGLIAFAAFETAYVAVSALASREHRLPVVRAWMRAHAGPDARVMAASYLCTDLPNRAYGYYRFARTGDELLRNIAAHRIAFVVVDDAEWNADVRDVIARRFELVERWSFGAVYRVAATASAARAVPVLPTPAVPAADSTNRSESSSRRMASKAN